MKKLFLVCSILLILVCAPTFADNCVGSIQNNSDEFWTVRYSTFDGNVYFTGGSCPVNGPCIIPPHTTMSVEYSHTKGYVTGRLFIEDSNHWLEKFSYGGKLWVRCPHIDHDGATGAVSLNEPANGSFVIEKDNWK